MPPETGLEPVVVIPAFQPGAALQDLVRDLRAMPGIGAVIVVDDGSGASYRARFFSLDGIAGVHVLRHPTNLGKGAALKTGLAFAARHFPASVGAVTADADGQHAAADVEHIARELRETPEALVIGARALNAGAPFRSRFGNKLTRWIMRTVTGQKLTDTQTGLRGIPLAFIPDLLKLPATHYDYELDMLVRCRESGRAIREVPIATIYINDNAGSHFRPLLDSLRVYLVFFRYSGVSLLTAALDNCIFVACMQFIPYIGLCQAVSRVTAGSFQFYAGKRGVFRSQAPVAGALLKFWLLSAATGASAYIMMRGLIHFTEIGVVPAKLIAETLMFLVSFSVQRDVVFAQRQEGRQRRVTD